MFYWFQNHKARERQKRRRELESDAGEEQKRDNNLSLERKESGDCNLIPPHFFFSLNVIHVEEGSATLQKSQQ